MKPYGRRLLHLATLIAAIVVAFAACGQEEEEQEPQRGEVV